MQPHITATLQQALSHLEHERATLDRQITALRSVLGQTKPAPGAQPARVTVVRRRKMSAAAKKLLSQKMKAVWAKRRAAQEPPKRK